MAELKITQNALEFLAREMSTKYRLIPIVEVVGKYSLTEKWTIRIPTLYRLKDMRGVDVQPAWEFKANGFDKIICEVSNVESYEPTEGSRCIIKTRAPYSLDTLSQLAEKLKSDGFDFVIFDGPTLVDKVCFLPEHVTTAKVLI